MILVSRMLYKNPDSPEVKSYSHETLLQMIECFTNSSDPIFGMYGISHSEYIQHPMLHLDSIATKVIELDVDDEGLVVYQEILDTPEGNRLLNVIGENSEHRLKFTSCLSMNGETPLLTGVLIEDVKVG